MERESFEDTEVANRLNRDFISIKVDKEERPDIDSVYMTVCQALTGSGGWPLTILMTPQQRPFYAGTYFPKHSRYSMPGLIELLDSAALQWRENREKLLKSGDQITKAVQGQISSAAGSLTKDMFFKAKSLFEGSFDSSYGGFGESPKFPSPHNLLFLLRFSIAEKDEYALAMVEKTLRQMYRGGIFDHIGFGFSRYSTDEKWLAPHFEKMLYDNALLMMAYLETFQVTGSGFYKMVAVKTMDYVLREMTDDGGGFYSAQDADSEGEEGRYYLFAPDEITAVLGETDGKALNDYFNITPKGNFEGKNIPNLIWNENYDKPDEWISQLLPKVYDYRRKRTQLYKDDKILTSWNALMIAAFAKAYRILGESRYLTVAEKAMCFLWDKLSDGHGGLYVRSRDGDAAGTGGLDDYAFTVWALLNLYEATFDADYLERAVSLNQEMMNRFYDSENGGFYLSASNAETLIYRPKEMYDGAIPSGNSVASYCLVKLSTLTGDPKLQEIADRQLKFMAGVAKEYPAGFSFSLIAMMLELYPSRGIVCVLKDDTDLERLKTLLHKKFLPNTAVLVKNADNAEKIESIAEFTKAYKVQDHQSLFYICENNACSQPINNFNELADRLH